jgi:hypothetical protein
VTAGSRSAKPTPFRCSTLSTELGEPLAGTASTVRNWLLVEQPGPWGARALAKSRLPTGVARRLRRLRRELGVRVLLIRRADRPLGPGTPVGRHLFMIHSGPEGPWMERLRVEAPEDVLRLDLEPLGRGVPPRIGERWAGPLFLVCTNGRRDPCCAERGRPVAAALASAHAEGVWECSHIGGDRFAATLVAFPHGLYFGRVGPGRGAAIADAYAAGRIDLPAFRGRSAYPFAAQAAEIHLRQAHGLDGVDDLRLTELTGGLADFVARFETVDGAPLGAAVRVSAADPARPFTCHAEGASNPPAFDVRELDGVSGG